MGLKARMIVKEKPKADSGLRPIPPGISLSAGSHERFQDGVCAMELVSWVAREPFGDHPKCVCPVLGEFVRSWNDALSDDDRDRLLLPIVPRLVGTRASEEVEERRAWLAIDWLIRTCAPAFLALVPSLREHAPVLSGMPPVLSRDVLISCAVALGAAWGAARAAAWNCALGAARDAAWDCALGAARAGAWDCALGAARNAARDAAWNCALSAARAAARDAAPDALRPTVEKLQQSAIALLDRMIAEGENQ